MIYDIAIIGGGVVGTAIARELARYRLRIVLLEKEAELAFGVSKSNSGIIHPGTQHANGSLKAKLCVEGNRLTRKLGKELGIEVKEVGELVVAFSEEDVARLRDIRREGEALGIPGLEIVGRDWLDKFEPNLAKEVIAALYAPTAAIISPYRWAYDLAENAARNGVSIQTDAKVTGINDQRRGTACRAPTARFEITTTKGIFSSRYVINAAGLYADDICRMVGVEDIKITPRKGEEFLLDKKRENITNHLIFPLPQKDTKGILVIKTSDGNPMIGPTSHDVEDKEDLSTSKKGFEEVAASVKRLVPFIQENDVIAYFSGLRPVAGDDFIIRHEDKAPGFITVAGIQSPGLTAAPAIAIYVSEILRKNGLKLRRKLFFHRRRKKETHLFAIPLEATKKLIKRDPAYGDIVCRCEMVSAKEIRDAVKRGAKTMDGIKFRTRCQAGRCHGSFCTTRVMKILSEETGTDITKITKRGHGSELVYEKRGI